MGRRRSTFGHRRFVSLCSIHLPFSKTFKAQTWDLMAHYPADISLFSSLATAPPSFLISAARAHTLGELYHSLRRNRVLQDEGQVREAANYDISETSPYSSPRVSPRNSPLVPEIPPRSSRRRPAHPRPRSQRTSALSTGARGRTHFDTDPSRNRSYSIDLSEGEADLELPLDPDHTKTVQFCSLPASSARQRPRRGQASPASCTSPNPPAAIPPVPTVPLPLPTPICLSPPMPTTRNRRPKHTRARSSFGPTWPLAGVSKETPSNGFTSDLKACATRVSSASNQWDPPLSPHFSSVRRTGTRLRGAGMAEACRMPASLSPTWHTHWRDSRRSPPRDGSVISPSPSPRGESDSHGLGIDFTNSRGRVLDIRLSPLASGECSLKGRGRKLARPGRTPSVAMSDPGTRIREQIPGMLSPPVFEQQLLPPQEQVSYEAPSVKPRISPQQRRIRSASTSSRSRQRSTALATMPRPRTAGALGSLTAPDSPQSPSWERKTDALFMHPPSVPSSFSSHTPHMNSSLSLPAHQYDPASPQTSARRSPRTHGASPRSPALSDVWTPASRYTTQSQPRRSEGANVMRQHDRLGHKDQREWLEEYSNPVRLHQMNGPGLGSDAMSTCWFQADGTLHEEGREQEMDERYPFGFLPRSMEAVPVQGSEEEEEDKVSLAEVEILEAKETIQDHLYEGFVTGGRKSPAGYVDQGRRRTATRTRAQRQKGQKAKFDEEPQLNPVGASHLPSEPQSESREEEPATFDPLALERMCDALPAADKTMLADALRRTGDELDAISLYLNERRTAAPDLPLDRVPTCLPTTAVLSPVPTAVPVPASALAPAHPPSPAPRSPAPSAAPSALLNLLSEANLISDIPTPADPLSTPETPSVPNNPTTPTSPRTLSSHQSSWAPKLAGPTKGLPLPKLPRTSTASTILSHLRLSKSTARSSPSTAPSTLLSPTTTEAYPSASFPATSLIN